MTSPTNDPTSGRTTGPGPKSIKEIEASLVARAWRDDAFRRRLIEEPDAVLEEELKANGLRMGNVRVRVLEETPDDYFLVLPLRPEMVMDDEEIEIMAATGKVRCQCGQSSMSFGGRSVDHWCDLSGHWYCPGMPGGTGGEDEDSTNEIESPSGE